MEQRRAINPKVLLAIGGLVLVVTSAIAIFMAVGYQPGGADAPTSTTVPTATTPAR